MPIKEEDFNRLIQSIKEKAREIDEKEKTTSFARHLNNSSANYSNLNSGSYDSSMNLRTFNGPQPPPPGCYFAGFANVGGPCHSPGNTIY